MKRTYRKPKTEIVILNSESILQEGTNPDQDSTGTITGQDPTILGNEGTFDEEESFGSSKSLWD